MDIHIPSELVHQAERWTELKLWERRELGRALRKLGLTFAEIRATISVAKSTLSGWCRDIDLTSEQIERIQSLGWKSVAAQEKAAIKRRETYRKRREAVREAARDEFRDLSNNRLFLAGAIAFWAEGSKRTKGIQISNSDPSLVRLFLRWASIYLGIRWEKFRIQLHLHKGQKEIASKNYWSQQTGLTLSQFNKTFYKKDGTGHRKNVLYHGTAAIRVSDWVQRERINAWLECLQEWFGPPGYTDSVGPLA